MSIKVAVVRDDEFAGFITKVCNGTKVNKSKLTQKALSEWLAEQETASLHGRHDQWKAARSVLRGCIKGGCGPNLHDTIKPAVFKPEDQFLVIKTSDVSGKRVSFTLLQAA